MKIKRFNESKVDRETIIGRITSELIDGGWSTIYDYVDKHTSDEEVQKMINPDPTITQRYKVIDNSEYEENNYQMIIDVLDISIKGVFFYNNISTISKVNDIYKEFCIENDYDYGELFVVKYDDGYFSATSSEEEHSIEFSKYCDKHRIVLDA